MISPNVKIPYLILFIISIIVTKWIHKVWVCVILNRQSIFNNDGNISLFNLIPTKWSKNAHQIYLLFIYYNYQKVKFDALKV